MPPVKALTYHAPPPRMTGNGGKKLCPMGDAVKRLIWTSIPNSIQNRAALPAIGGKRLTCRRTDKLS